MSAHFHCLRLGLAALAISSCGRNEQTPAVPASTQAATKTRVIEVIPDAPEPGVPIRLLGRADFVCAERFQSPIACIGSVDIALTPVIDTPHESEPYPGKGRPHTERPWAIHGLEATEIVTRQSGTTCIRTQDDSLRCWPTPDGRHVPTEPPWAPKSIAVAVGLQTCNVDPAGAVKCWSQSLCRTGGVFRYPDLPPSDVQGVEDAISVAAGSWYSCALSSQGEVSCWGRLDGPEQCTDLVARRIDGITHAMQIISSRTFACALERSNEVKCWGDNSQAALGVPTSEIEFTAKAVEVPDLDDIVELTAYAGGIVALKANGEVWYWGDDLTARDPDKRPRKVPEITNAIDIVAGSEYGCALLADHNLRCFGPRIERGIERRTDGLKRPPFEDKQAWIDAREFDIWWDYDAPKNTEDAAP